MKTRKSEDFMGGQIPCLSLSWTVMKEINDISLDAITCTFSLKKSQAEALVHWTQSLEGLAQPKSSKAPMNTYMFKLYELAHFTK
jgi:hypothetical protein